MARPVLVALALLIALSTIFMGAHLPTARGVAAPHPAATLFITPENGYGGSTFYPGPTYGDVYFFAEDFASDTTGVVTIHDLNYSRDNVPDPAATWTIAFQGGQNDSLGTANYYAIPPSLVDSGQWNITLTAGGVFASSNFVVQTYWTNSMTDQRVYLPGHHGVFYWTVSTPANDAPFNHVQTLQVAGTYLTSSGTTVQIPGLTHDLVPNASGSFAFVVPSDASAGSTAHFALWANQSGPGVNFSSADSVNFYIGQATNVNLDFQNCPLSCGSFAANTPIFLQVAVPVSSPGGAGFGQGLTAKLSFMNGPTTVAPPAGTPTTLTLNASGEAAVIFIGSTTVFSTTLANTVKVSVSDALNPALTLSNSLPFYLTTETQSARLQLVLNQFTYYSGDNVSGTYTLGGANASGPTGWTPGVWEAYSITGNGQVFAQGYPSSNASSGTVTFTLPADFTGTFYVVVSAYNTTREISAYSSATVISPSLLLNPSELTYKAGDSIQVGVTTEGQVFSSATIYEITSDGSGNVIQSGTISGNSFDVTVPSVAPPPYLTFAVAAQTDAGGVIATAMLTVALQTGYLFHVSIETASSYSDGSYQPGQTVTIAYTLDTLGNTKLPSELSIEVIPSANIYQVLFGGVSTVPGSALVTTTASSGSFSFTIPSGLPNGNQQFLVLAFPTNNGGCSLYYGGCLSVTQMGVNVQSNPAALNYVVGSGSGLTLGWLVLFLLILILLIVGILWARKRMGSGGTGGGSGGRAPAAPWSGGSNPPSSGGSGSSGSGDSPPPPMPGGAS